MAIIEVKNLSKTYEYQSKSAGLWASFSNLWQGQKFYTHAIKNLNFKIEEGELVGFLGPNGSGKTTTLKILSGVLYPTEGKVQVLGYFPWERKKSFQKQFALVLGQKNQLWWDLPAMESFILNKEIYEMNEKNFNQNLSELIEILDLKKLLNTPVRKLSLGERTKCELTAALLHKPKVLFLDEPTLGLDVLSQQKIHEFIQRYNQKYKTTIFFTSHYMNDIERLCQRIIIINSGQIIYDGSLKGLMDKYIDYKILEATYTKEISYRDLKMIGKIKEYKKNKVIFKIPKNEIKNKTVKLLANFPIDDILIKEVELEEIIRKIF